MQVPAPFDYARASSIDDAIALLERLGPESRLVAGGHSLLPMMKLRRASPSSLRSAATAEDTAGSLTPSASAAPLTDPSRATVANERSCAKVTSARL